MPFAGSHFDMSWLDSLEHQERREKFCAFHHNQILTAVLALGPHIEGESAARHSAVPDSPIAACLGSSQVSDARRVVPSTGKRETMVEKDSL